MQVSQFSRFGHVITTTCLCNMAYLYCNHAGVAPLFLAQAQAACLKLGSSCHGVCAWCMCVCGDEERRMQVRGQQRPVHELHLHYHEQRLPQTHTDTNTHAHAHTSALLGLRTTTFFRHGGADSKRFISTKQQAATLPQGRQPKCVDGNRGGGGGDT